jgi:hypothetical protein
MDELHSLLAQQPFPKRHPTAMLRETARGWYSKENENETENENENEREAQDERWVESAQVIGERVSHPPLHHGNEHTHTHTHSLFFFIRRRCFDDTHRCCCSPRSLVAGVAATR